MDEEIYARPNPIPRGPGGRFAKDKCFITEQVYGTTEANEVAILRGFRDKRLRGNMLGRALISSYYNLSPSLEAYAKQSPKFHRFSRKVCDLLAGVLC